MPHTLLLADDSVTIQRVIELTFADEDIRVIAVGDGQQAIDLITADPPDIVLADTGMPERDGYDVATFIKEDPALAHIPVVLLTGAFEPVDEDRARQVGCDAVLVKPFEPQVVINRVRELLGGRSAPGVPASSSQIDVVRAQDDVDATDAPTQHAETAWDPAHDWDETVDLAARHASSRETEVVPPAATDGHAISSDDPLEDYLERMDEAFDRLDAGEPVTSGRARTAGEEVPSGVQATSAAETDLDPLEGALNELEGALDKFGLDSLDAHAEDDLPDEGAAVPWTAGESSPPPEWSVEAPVVVAPPVDGPPAASASQVAPEPEPDARAVSVPQPSSEIAIERTSVTETPRPADSEGPSSASPDPVPDAPSLSEPMAPVLEPIVAPAGEPTATSLLSPYPVPDAPSSSELMAPVPEPIVAPAGELTATSLPSPDPVPDAPSSSGLMAPVPEPIVAPAGELTATSLPPPDPSLRPVPEAGVPPVGVAAPAADTPVSATPPSLADAFASLLAAEQGDAERAQTVYPWPRPVSLPAVSEELIERVAERVIARLSDGVGSELVAQVVARVAEKLVREEIDRITRA